MLINNVKINLLDNIPLYDHLNAKVTGKDGKETKPYREWISDSGTMVLAKLKLSDGSEANICSTVDLIKYGIDKYNLS
jgi:hypothetical protein